MIIFFTFLTWYSAYFNKVTDCGCFGDAIKLTPWESFTKDVVLLVMIAFLYFKKNLIKPLLKPPIENYVIVFSLILCILITYRVLNHLPILDFRAYKIGDNIIIHSAGAYGSVMSSNYNSRPKVPEVLVSGKSISLIRKRETIEQILENEVVL